MTAAFTSIPAELRERKQWVARAADKKPYASVGKLASSTDASTWLTLDEAQKLVEQAGLAGVGFVFNGDFTGVDLDHVRDPETGVIAPWAEDIIRDLGSYTEVSPSGTGVHVIVKATLGGPGKKVNRPDGSAIELYDRGRYFTVTGDAVPGTVSAIAASQAAVTKLYGTVAPVAAPSPSALGPALALDDLLAKIEAAEPRLFHRLFIAGETAPGKTESESDAALAKLCARFTQDPAVIRAVLDRSALVRPKWKTHRTYLDRTIAHALRTVSPDAVTAAHEAVPVLDDTELAALPPPEWRIEDLLPEDVGAVLYGRRSVYKTFTVLDWGLSIQTGQPWLGRAVKRGQYVHVAAEGWGGLQKRVHAWKLAHQWSGPIGASFVKSGSLRTDAAVARLIDAIRAKIGDRPVGLLDLDTLNRLLPGIEENSPEAMGRAVGITDRFRAAFPGATVVWVHHSGWDDDHLRGHSSLGDDLDVIMHIEAEIEPRTVELVCEKQKDADEFEPIRLLAVEHGDSLALTEAVSQGAGSPLSSTETAVLDALTSALGSGSEPVSNADWYGKAVARKVRVSGGKELTRWTFNHTRRGLIKKGRVIGELKAGFRPVTVDRSPE